VAIDDAPSRHAATSIANAANGTAQADALIDSF
jgi:hypothetical protein